MAPPTSPRVSTIQARRLSVLAERLLAVSRALDSAGLPHAFGGAIALAYCTHEPRGTRDLDVNIFITPDRSSEALDAMPPGVTITKAARAELRREGQVRVMWGDTPLDLFLDVDAFHTRAASGVREVPFEGTVIKVLGCEALIVFKAMYGRTKDRADIEAMIEAGADGRAALGELSSVLGPTHDSVVWLTGIVAPAPK